jgi:hypothetical protein
METGDIDILMLLFSLNVTPTPISQIMEQLKEPVSGTFLLKHVYDMKKKTEEHHDFAHGWLPDSYDAEKTLSKLEKAISTTSISYMTILGCTHVLKVVLVMRK